MNIYWTLLCCCCCCCCFSTIYISIYTHTIFSFFFYSHWMLLFLFQRRVVKKYLHTHKHTHIRWWKKYNNKKYTYFYFHSFEYFPLFFIFYSQLFFMSKFMVVCFWRVVAVLFLLFIKHQARTILRTSRKQCQ